MHSYLTDNMKMGGMNMNNNGSMNQQYTGEQNMNNDIVSERGIRMMPDF